MLPHLATHSQHHLHTLTKHPPQHLCIKHLPNFTKDHPHTRPKLLRDTNNKVTKDVAEAAGAVADEAEAAEAEAVDTIKAANKASKDKVSRTIKEHKDKDISKTHKAFMGTKKSMLPSPTPPSFSITGTTAGLMDTMCLMDTPVPHVPILPRNTSGTQHVRIPAMDAARDNTKQPGLDGEGRKRFH